MTSEQQSPVNNGHYFWVSRVIVVHRFDCICICLLMTQHSYIHNNLFPGLHITNSLTVVASDRDRASFFAAQEMSTRYRSGNLIPLQSRFTQLPRKLSEARLNDYFDAVIIETGISQLQWNDAERGFCSRRKGRLSKKP